jgi:hypothetical protein
MATTDQIIKAVDTIARTTAKKATSKLRSEAYSNGWPTELSRTLSILHDKEGRFSMDYPQHLESKIFDVEFGTQNTPPNPVMRRFLNRLDETSDEFDSMMGTLLDNWEVF